MAFVIWKKSHTKKFKWMIALIVILLLTAVFSITAFATSTGNVVGAVEGTWKAASSRVKTVVNNVVFPVINPISMVLLFAKMATAYMDYRRYGQIEWTPATILFAGLVFNLLAPMYVWQTIGIQEVK